MNLSSPSVRRVLPGVLLVAAVLGYHARVLPPGLAFNQEDLREYFIPVRALLQHIVRQGEWPFWQRSIYTGFPAWGSAEWALFVPTTWLFLPLSPARALSLGSLTHLVVAGLGMLTWQRYRGQSAGAALASALLVALGGFTSVHLEHWTFSATLAPLPWTLLALDVARRHGLSPGLFLGTALGIAGLWYGGAAQLAYFATLLVGGYVLLLVLASRGRQWNLLLVLPAGLLLAAPLLLASAELSAYSPRAGGMTLEWAAFYHWPSPRYLALLLFPDAFGVPPQYSGEYNYWEMTAYVGLPVLGVVLGTRPRGQGWYFLAVLVLALLTAFGNETPLYGALFRFLPGFDKLRVATRTFFLVNFTAACLLAPALDALAERRWRRTMPVVLVTLGLLGVALWVAARAQALGYRSESLLANEPWTVGVLAAFAVWAALLAVPRLAGLFPAGTALLLFVDLNHAHGHYNPVAPEDNPALSPPRVSLAKSVPPGRVVYFGVNPNLAAYSGVEGAFGYSQLLVGRIYDLLLASHTNHFTILSGEPLRDEYGKLWASLDSPLFPLFAAPSLLSAQPLGERYRLESPGPLWRYPAPALPLAFWTRSYEVKDDEHFRQDVLHFRPFDTLVLAPTAEPLPPPGPTPTPLPATLLSRGTNHLELEVSAPAAGLVTVMDPWFPGWSAEVDGHRVPLLRADYAFMALAVPEGTHRIQLRYVPTTLLPGLAAVLSVVLGTLGWVGWRRREAARGRLPNPTGSPH